MEVIIIPQRLIWVPDTMMIAATRMTTAAEQPILRPLSGSYVLAEVSGKIHQPERRYIMRLQLALNVDNLDEAVSYYSKLFNAEPHKRRPGYANFAIEQPPLKLVLFENPDAAEQLNHLGVEIFDAGQVDAAAQRLAAAGILDQIQHHETCCHATQDKVWSREPQGLSWEWYRITDDDPAPAAADAAATCCDTGQPVNKVCCA
jgi:catechol 2,3-dioxygenase-like lactoylglutathione lyase family enzyme